MEVVVIGAGVSGLTCAVRLQEAGLPTRVVTRQPPRETTSAVAAATWYPYELPESERAARWSLSTLATLYAMTEAGGAGARVTRLVEAFDKPTPEPWWSASVREFRRGRGDDVPPGFHEAHASVVPLVEPQVYLGYLENRFADAGGELHNFPAGIDDLTRLYEPERLIVNCSGLGARTLVGDEGVYPVRGQAVRVENPGLERSLLVQRDPRRPTYVFARGNDCILGGTADGNEWDTSIDPAVSADILERCAALEPRLRDVRVFGSAVGLRPARAEVRLELERSAVDRCAVIHNYGHGGNGFTLSWGCADDVLQLAREFCRDG